MAAKSSQIAFNVASCFLSTGSALMESSEALCEDLANACSAASNLRSFMWMRASSTRACSGLGAARAKQMMFTGNVIDGRTAAAWGLANEAVPEADLEATTMRLAERIAGVPRSHLAMHKMVVNQVMLTMGLEQTQMMATVFDGITRHNPEGLWFRRYAQDQGFKAAVQWRDSGRPIPEGDEARALVREMENRKRSSPEK